jgi:hypothetical protein
LILSSATAVPTIKSKYMMMDKINSFENLRQVFREKVSYNRFYTLMTIDFPIISLLRVITSIYLSMLGFIFGSLLSTFSFIFILGYHMVMMPFILINFLSDGGIKLDEVYLIYLSFLFIIFICNIPMVIGIASSKVFISLGMMSYIDAIIETYHEVLQIIQSFMWWPS